MVMEGIGICSWCCRWQEGALTLGRCFSSHSPFCLEQSSLRLCGEGHPREGGHPSQWPWPMTGGAVASQALAACNLLLWTLVPDHGKIYGGETSFAILFPSRLGLSVRSRPRRTACTALAG